MVYELLLILLCENFTTTRLMVCGFPSGHSTENSGSIISERRIDHVLTSREHPVSYQELDFPPLRAISEGLIGDSCSAIVLILQNDWEHVPLYIISRLLIWFLLCIPHYPRDHLDPVQNRQLSLHCWNDLRTRGSICFNASRSIWIFLK